MKRELNVIIERDEDGYFVGTVPELKGCYTQAKSLDILLERIKEAAALCLEVENEFEGNGLEFVGTRVITFDETTYLTG